MVSHRFAPAAPVALACLLGIAVLTTPAVAAALAGRAPARAFTPADYDAHPQCWSMTQDAQGRVLVGNTAGLLTYDGTRWELDRLPNASAVLAVARGADDRVYVGGTATFGRIERGPDDRAVYHALDTGLAPDDRPFGDVWTVLPHGDAVLFATLHQIYRLDAHGHVERLDESLGADLREHIFALAVWRDALWVGVSGKGLYRWADGGFDLVHAAEDPKGEKDARFAFDPSALISLVPTADDLLVFEYDRIWRFDGRGITPFASECETTLVEDWVYVGRTLDDGSVLIGTIESGLHRLDTRGRVLGHWDASNDLLIDAVNELGVDDEGGLWVCQEAGVVRIDLDATVRRFPEVPGLINDAARIGDRSLVATSAGLFELDAVDSAQVGFRPLRTGDDITSVAPSAHGAIVAGSGWVARWQDGAWSNTIRADYPADLQRSRFHPDRLYAIARDGLHVFTDAPDTLRLEAVLELPQQGSTLAELSSDEVWVGSRQGHVTRLVLGNDGRSIASLEELGAEHGVPASYAFLRVFDGHVVLASSEGLRVYVRGAFRSPPLDGLQDGVFDQIEVVDNELWTLVDGAVGRVRANEVAHGKWVWTQRLSANRSSGRVHAFAVTDADVWATRAGETVRWAVDATRGPDKPFLPRLRRVAVDGRTVWSPTSGTSTVTIAPDPGAVHFEFAPGTMGGAAAAAFRTRLDGVDRGWSPWTPNASRAYTNLDPGRYVLHVRSRDANGATSHEVAVPVHVEPTWLQSGTGLFVRVFLMVSSAILVGALTAMWRSSRLRRRNKELELAVRESTHELASMNQRLHASNVDLRAVNETLQRIDAQRLELLDMASHDLKNPLGSIVSTADALLEEPALVASNPELVELIREASDRMLERVDALIAEARSEVGALDLASDALDAAAIAQRVVDAEESRVASRRQSIDVRAHVDDPHFVGDRERLEAVLRELVARTSARAPEGATLHIDVCATGAGAMRFAVHDRIDATDCEGALTALPRSECSATLHRVVELHGGQAWWTEGRHGIVAHGVDVPRSTAAQTVAALRTEPVRA